MFSAHRRAEHFKKHNHGAMVRAKQWDDRGGTDETSGIKAIRFPLSSKGA